MDHPYQPKYPRAKLREIVVKHLGALRLAGLQPNSRVTFGASGSGSPEVRGWLIADPRRRPAEVRYLLLEDGDVWREIEAPQPVGEDAARVWLSGPDDDLVTLLAQSRNDAQRGGTGFLVAEELVELAPRVVDDRREGSQPYAGPERRRA